MAEQSLPSGTVTLWFTDVEDSTRRWADDELGMRALMAQHDELVDDVLAKHGGALVKHNGDGIDAVFTSASHAVAAAIDAQERLQAIGLPVRMGLHTGEAELRDRDYFGSAVNIAARIMDSGHGGQILMSEATHGLVGDHEMLDLGVYELKGIAAPQRIFQLGRRTFPALRTASAGHGNLPVEFNEFIGRDVELGELTEHLAAHRLVTLLGVGGTGKTRLAIEAAHASTERFPDGCWLVELARVTVPEAVPVAVCVGLGIVAPESGDVIELVVRRLRDQRRLVVLDNCEHLLGAAADAAERIVQACPNVVVLATSREPLMVAGERLVPTPSLSQDDARSMFLERARAEAPQLMFDDVQMAAVEQLCERLDRLPLAIELAASRMRSMSPVDAAQRLDQRFRLLVGGRRSRMERHQTMRGTVEWSYELCDAVEQRVFDRVSVFAEHFDLELAVAIAADDEVDPFDAEDAVARLVDRSLIQRHVAPDGASRYRLLETMRAFGHERLVERGEADAVREQHAAAIASRVGRLSLRSMGPDEAEVHRELRGLAADGLVALDWSLDRDDWERAYRVACGYYFAAPGLTFAMMDRIRERIREMPAAHFDHGYPALIASVASGLAGTRRAAGSPGVLEYGESFAGPPDDHWAFGPIFAFDPSLRPDGRPLDIVHRWLEKYDDGPQIAKFQELLAAVDGTMIDLRSEELEVARRWLDEATALAEDMDSETARVRLIGSELLIADLIDTGSDLIDRARSALAMVTDPSGGDMYMAARLLRIVARHGTPRQEDLVRPLRWSLSRATRGTSLVLSQISTVVALSAMGNVPLARRLAGTIVGEWTRTEVCRLHESRLPASIVDDLRHQPESGESLDSVFADIERFAATIAD